MTFVPGDRVTVAGVIAPDDWANTLGWCMVAFDGYRVLVRERDVTLVGHEPTPGQRAYESFALSTDGHFILWTDLASSVRDKWERVAEAARG